MVRRRSRQGSGSELKLPSILLGTYVISNKGIRIILVIVSTPLRVDGKRTRTFTGISAMPPRMKKRG